MRYEAYEGKMQRAKRTVEFVLGHIALFVLAALVLIGLLVSFSIVKGHFTQPARISDYTYGDKAGYSAKAFLSGVNYSFLRQDGEDIGARAPHFPGRYSLIATSRGVFRENRSSALFTVHERTLKVGFPQPVPVGSSPGELAELAEVDGLAPGDRVVGMGAVLPPHPGVLPLTFDVSETVILNEAGEDVTACYRLVPDGAALVAIPRELRIETNSLTRVFNRKPPTEEGRAWEITEGTLIEGHRAVVSFRENDGSVGTFKNEIDVRIVDASGADFTDCYAITVDCGEIETLPIVLKVTTSSASKVYDGEPLYSDEFTVTEGELLPGEVLTATYWDEYTEVGSYFNKIVLQIFENGDVTKPLGGYELKFTYGTIRIDPRTLTVRTGSAEKYYDGTPLTCKEWELIGGELVDGHDLTVTPEGSVTYPGSTDNPFHARVTLRNGDTDVTKNYVFAGDLGTLTVLPSKLWDGVGDKPGGETSSAIQRSPTEMSSETLYSVYAEYSGRMYLRGKSYGDYTGNGFAEPPVYRPTPALASMPIGYFADVLQLSRVKSEYVTIQKAWRYMQTVTPDYACVDMNGNPYPGDGQNEFSETSAAGYSFTCFPQYTDYSCSRKLDEEIASGYKGYGEFVKSAFTKVPANLVRVLSEAAARANLTGESSIAEIAAAVRGMGVYNFDFEPYPADADIVAYFLEKSKEGVCAHFAAVGTMLFRYLGYPARYTTGYYAIVEKNMWIDVPASAAHAWVEVYLEDYGWVRVDVTGRTAGNNGGNNGNGNGGNGDKGDDNGSGGSSGHGNGNGSEGGGGISGDPIPMIVVRAASGEKEYDGKPLSCSGIIFYGTLKEGHRVVGKAEGSFTEIGVWMSKIVECRILDENDHDVSGQYTVYKIPGTLTIRKRHLKIVTASASKPYDGLPLTADHYWIKEGSLLVGHSIRAVFKDGSAKIGQRKNSFSEFEIVEYINGDREYRELSDFYEVTFEYGNLRIYEE